MLTCASLHPELHGTVFHSTRKWFITQCERTGVPEHFTATLVGHHSARSANKLTYGLYSAGISDDAEAGDCGWGESAREVRANSVEVSRTTRPMSLCEVWGGKVALFFQLIVSSDKEARVGV